MKQAEEERASKERLEAAILRLHEQELKHLEVLRHLSGGSCSATLE
jgi:hypothetical protein